MKPVLPRGIITVLNTPFTSDDHLDTESLGRNVTRAAHAGVAGFLVPAMAAEVYTLTDDERRVMVRTVVETATKGAAGSAPVPVIGSATARTAEDRLRHCRSLLGSGCAAALVAVDPPEDALAEAALITELRELADAAGIPLVVQDWAPAGPGLSLEFIARLAHEVPEARGLKVEVIPSGPKFTAIRERFGDRFHLSGGWTVLQLIEALDRGVDAFMPTGMHEVYVAIDRAYRSGNRDESRRIFNEVVPVLAFSNQHLDTSIHFFKRLLHAEGTYATAACRTSTAAFDEHHERIAAELVEYACQLPARLPAMHGATPTSDHAGEAAE